MNQSKIHFYTIYAMISCFHCTWVFRLISFFVFLTFWSRLDLNITVLACVIFIFAPFNGASRKSVLSRMMSVWGEIVETGGVLLYVVVSVLQLTPRR